MHLLYKFAKRNSPSLFVPKYGMASHIYDFNSKFLFNKYGEVKHFYNADTEIAKIEVDIRELIKEEFKENAFRKLIEPVDMFI